MKKYGFILCILIACTFMSMISNSAAIYTHSSEYKFDISFIKYPIIKGDFVKYELSGGKFCDYDFNVIGSPASGTNCQQGSASYDENKNLVSLQHDAGFFKYYADNSASYIVDGTFDYDESQMPKNFGMYFNGSLYRLDHSVVEVQSNGYVLKFDEVGNLVVYEQGVVNYQDALDHNKDTLKTMKENPIRKLQIATQEQVAQILQNQAKSSTIDLQVRVFKDDRSLMRIYVYVNGVRINENSILVGPELRDFNAGGIYANVMIGASAYGSGSVDVVYLERKNWDGVDLK